MDVKTVLNILNLYKKQSMTYYKDKIMRKCRSGQND